MCGKILKALIFYGVIVFRPFLDFCFTFFRFYWRFPNNRRRKQTLFSHNVFALFPLPLSVLFIFSSPDVFSSVHLAVPRDCMSISVSCNQGITVTKGQRLRYVASNSNFPVTHNLQKAMSNLRFTSLYRKMNARVVEKRLLKIVKFA